ncbi:putative transcriptional regulator [Corynebacterium kutscheri]|uniref:Transcriptional regulator n=1 Tax=Corynebacterium kutscheri TaxID=35755 RepID=A0A0F6TEJ2_9CORY|nr:FadR/GntR family transcriptional regulator [Corynebacterium kutscheri]AKE42221.1 transcriptional regulator [Corynebacterium kutscheri]VEH05734.1 putative transcriptional regulator [Corynebacterium kutscheri]VEH10564.1 putative transcriptional regulator [Corynebacterium kutscheri]VEH81629.1 putative transcriptional regulator [Corynebacterium kutscheri]
MRKDRVTLGVDRIMQSIANGEFQPGQALPSEANLAAFLDVSRPTMREVVRTLADRGVVEVVHGRGTFVAEVSAWTDVRSRVDIISRTTSKNQVGFYLTEVRRMIEVGASGHAAARATDEDIARMRAALDAYDAAVVANDVLAIVDADVEFHTALIEASKNPFITAVMIPLADELAASRYETSSVPEVCQRAQKHHREIFVAVKNRDEEGAKNAMRRHMTQTFDDIARFVDADD